jgi:hypothetical protein
VIRAGNKMPKTLDFPGFLGIGAVETATRVRSNCRDPRNLVVRLGEAPERSVGPLTK